jgi:hypothetical protein
MTLEDVRRRCIDLGSLLSGDQDDKTGLTGKAIQKVTAVQTAADATTDSGKVPGFEKALQDAEILDAETKLRARFSA